MIEQQTTQAAQAERFSLRVIHAIMRANLSVAHKHLLNLICYHHNDERGYAWPSVERLAFMAGGVEARTIQRQLRTLQNLGLIDIQPMPGMRTNAYRLQEEAIAAIALSGITWPKNVVVHPTFACATPDTSVTLPRHQSAPTLTLDATYPDTGVTLTEEERTRTRPQPRPCQRPNLPTPQTTSPASPPLPLLLRQPQKPKQPLTAKQPPPQTAAYFWS